VDTGNWKNAKFNHSSIGGTDCSACHSGRKPANHYAGACNACHKDTGNWRNASFSHPQFNIYHEKTNGACANCHPNVSNYKQTDCVTCHQQRGEGPGSGKDEKKDEKKKDEKKKKD
jgi:mono/diheme cytochrome c family protein